MARPRNIAVALSGCGVQDGSEIHEAVLTLLAIDRAGSRYQCFAPDVKQARVVNHVTGKPTSEVRNVLVESARIARGKIRNLAEFKPAEFDALIFPGGFGAALNLCSFGADGPDCRVDPAAEAAIRGMHAAGKPIGALCIAPALIARVLGEVELTVGANSPTAEALRSMGARHVATGHGQVVVDRKARLVTTPCYMLDATISQIALGADNLVKAVLELVSA